MYVRTYRQVRLFRPFVGVARDYYRKNRKYMYVDLDLTAFRAGPLRLRDLRSGSFCTTLRLVCLKFNLRFAEKRQVITPTPKQHDTFCVLSQQSTTMRDLSLVS